jgi:hypothetical protein
VSSRRRPFPQCSHGLDDSVEMTFRHTFEDFITGRKVAAYGYWCKSHRRHGTFRTEEQVRKLDLSKMEAEP